MDHALKWILKYGGGIAFLIIIVWPCLALPAGVFSKGYFTFWVIISIVWGLVRPLWGLMGVVERVASTYWHVGGRVCRHFTNLQPGDWQHPCIKICMLKLRRVCQDMHALTTATSGTLTGHTIIFL